MVKGATYEDRTERFAEDGPFHNVQLHSQPEIPFSQDGFAKASSVVVSVQVITPFWLEMEAETNLFKAVRDTKK